VIGKDKRGPSPGAGAGSDGRERGSSVGLIGAGGMSRTGSSEGAGDKVSLEKRVVHLLALNPLSFADIHAKVKGSKEQLLEALESVCHRTSSVLLRP
jgi:hypothetical protein